MAETDKDLCERLDDLSDYLGTAPGHDEEIATVREAKAELTRLREENDRLRQDLAMRPSSLTTLYAIRKAMGLNEYFPLTHLETHCQSARRALYGEPTAPAGESLLDLAERASRRLRDYQARR